MQTELTEGSVAQLEELSSLYREHVTASATLHPDWYLDFESICPAVAEVDMIRELITKAPDPFCTGFIYGIVAARQTLSIITGRPFDYTNPISWKLPTDVQEHDWAHEFDSLDPIICEPADLIGLLQTSPTDWSRGLISGISEFRIEIALVVNSNLEA